MKSYGTIEFSTLDELFKLNIDELTLRDSYIFKLMIENNLSLTIAEFLKTCLIKNIPKDLHPKINLDIQSIDYNKGFSQHSVFIVENILLKAKINYNDDLIKVLSRILTLSSQRIKFKTEPHVGQFQQFLGLLIYYSKDLHYLVPICSKISTLYSESERKIIKPFEYNLITMSAKL